MPRDRVHSVRFSEGEESMILRAVHRCGSAGLNSFCREASVTRAEAELSPLGTPIQQALSELQRDINRAIGTSQRIYLRSAGDNPERAGQELEGAMKAIEDIRRELERTIHELLNLKRP